MVRVGFTRMVWKSNAVVVDNAALGSLRDDPATATSMAGNGPGPVGGKETGMRASPPGATKQVCQSTPSFGSGNATGVRAPTVTGPTHDKPPLAVLPTAISLTA